MLRPLTLAALTAGALSFSTLASAHNVWLLPSATVLAKAETITVDAAVSNDLFFFNHVPLALDNLRIEGPDGRLLQAENPHRGKLRSVFDLKVEQPGSHRLAVVNQGLFASYLHKGERKRWRGTPEALAGAIPADASEVQVTESLGRIETWVTLGKPSLPAPLGRGMELRPVTHPNDLVSGEEARFALLVDGQPASGVEVTAIRGGTRYRDRQEEMTTKTDARGEFAFTWQQPGMYWLEASAKDDKVSVPAAKERRLMYVVTLEVMPQ